MTYALFQDPSPDSDAGRVLAVVRTHPGLLLEVLTERSGLGVKRVVAACHYLKKRRKIFKRSVSPTGETQRNSRRAVYWYPGAAPVALQLVDAQRCQVAMGYRSVCDTRLEHIVDSVGRVRVTCPSCERRRQGLCRSCPRRLPPNPRFGPQPWFCRTCLRQRRRDRARLKDQDTRRTRAA